MNIPTDAPHMILWMIGGCIAVMLVLIFTPSLRPLLRGIARGTVRGAAGLLAVFLLNIAVAPMGAAVGLNALTAGVAAVLGVPGVAVLYAAQVLL